MVIFVLIRCWVFGYGCCVENLIFGSRVSMVLELVSVLMLVFVR